MIFKNFVFFVFFLNFGTLFAVVNNDTLPKQNIVKLDTFNYKYDFRVGDTLIYAVMSQDSIVIDWGDPLLRIRYETIMLTCDSITPSGNFLLRQQLVNFSSRESYSDDKNISRNTTPWLNIVAYIEIDSLGRRFNTWHDDSLSLMVSPGGAFQPFIIFPLESKNIDTICNIKRTNESWMVDESIFFLPENSNPSSVLRASFFYRLIGMIDTLDFGSLLKMTFAVTSQGAHIINSDEIKMYTTSINNAGGEFWLDTTYWVPKYYFHTIEQRLTIEDKIDNHKSTGFHFIHSTFVLDTIIRNK